MSSTRNKNIVKIGIVFLVMSVVFVSGTTTISDTDFNVGNNTFRTGPSNGLGIVEIHADASGLHGLYINGTTPKRTLFVGVNEIISSDAGIAGFYVYTGNEQTGSNPLALIEQDNALATIRNLYLHQDGNGNNLYLACNGNGTCVQGVQAKALDTDNSMFRFYDNQIETAARNLIEFKLDNAGSTINLLEVENDGNGKGIFLDQNGNGIGLNIDSESNRPPLLFDSNTTVVPCNSTNAGGIVYIDSTANRHAGCDGTNWKNFY